MRRNSRLALQQNCHPDRSEAQWRDLLFFPARQLRPGFLHTHWKRFWGRLVGVGAADTEALESAF
jgi:hypothetical protein